MAFLEDLLRGPLTKPARQAVRADLEDLQLQWERTAEGIRARRYPALRWTSRGLLLWWPRTGEIRLLRR